MLPINGVKIMWTLFNVYSLTKNIWKKTKKGMKILVKGRLQQNTYTDADTGTTIYYHEVVGKVLELIGKINTEDVSKKKTDKSEVVKDINDTTIERERY